MKKLPFLFLLCSLLLCCTDNKLDCSAVDCFGFSAFAFQLVQDGENYVASEDFTLDQVSLTGAVANEAKLSIESYFSGDEETKVLVLFSPNWEQRTYDFNLNIANDTTFNIKTKIKKTASGGCCGGLSLVEELAIDDVTINRPYDLILLQIN